ncbi:MAG: YkgJ family cysteine cluster protein [Planctomycetaceae bacterium]|nr:YkgJ family cysteine cluster protein [Planctomycetaceae bacterium]
MSGYRLELPTIQNWSCHNCGGCCRQHLIEVTDEEKRRIESQGWTPADGIPADRPIFVWHAGAPWNKQYRLGHQPDGGCVFLDERGLCRIHAKFGEAAKPLACRIYPYAFHPAGQEVTVSLRFSCPSVVGNKGKPISQQKEDVKATARLVVPEDVTKLPPPPIHAAERLDWSDTLRIVGAIEDSLIQDEGSVIARLLRTLYWMEFLGKATFSKIRGERIDELIDLIREASYTDVPTVGDTPLPTSIARMQFRLLVAQYARRDTALELERRWSYRWKLLRAATRFARGQGMIPPLQAAFREVPFEAIEASFGGLPAGADELFTRYLEVKIHGMHFCGRGYYDIPVVEGFFALALVVPAVLWLARWLAVGADRKQLILEDIERALAIADHHHGYDPALGQSTARRRVRQLAATNEIGRLVAWYSR